MYRLKELCDKLNAAGIEVFECDALTHGATTWKVGNTMIASLQYLPEENFQKILDMNYEGFESFRDIYSEWGRRGYLRFEPYLRDMTSHPSVTIRHDRHLHMFRGYYFQASGTPGGVGSYGIGSYRTDFLVHHNFGTELWEQSLLVNTLCYAAMIDTAFVFDNFRRWFKGHADQVDDFMHQTFRYWNMDLKYKWKDIQQLITTSMDWSSMDRKLYRLQGKNGSLCEFAFGAKSVEVKTCAKNLSPYVLRVEIPDAFKGVECCHEYDPDDLEEFEERTQYPRGNEERVDIKMILLMALSLAGVKLNWNSFYATDAIKTFTSTNIPGLTTILTLNDLDDCKPDKF